MVMIGRTLLALPALALAAGCAGTGTPPAATSPPLTSSPVSSPQTPRPSGTTGATCDAGLWSHVYHPRRLHVVSACATVAGTVEEVRQEADGDVHVLLRLDPAYAGLVNAANVADQRGDLVLEEICTGPVTQPDAVAACRAFTPPGEPAVSAGDHVTVTGSYVLDASHGWMEIHPVSHVSVTRRTS